VGCGCTAHRRGGRRRRAAHLRREASRAPSSSSLARLRRLRARRAAPLAVTETRCAVRRAPGCGPGSPPRRPAR
jgi:hypothetical protein